MSSETSPQEVSAYSFLQAQTLNWAVTHYCDLLMFWFAVFHKFFFSLLHQASFGLLWFSLIKISFLIVAWNNTAVKLMILSNLLHEAIWCRQWSFVNHHSQRMLCFLLFETQTRHRKIDKQEIESFHLLLKKFPTALIERSLLYLL